MVQHLAHAMSRLVPCVITTRDAPRAAAPVIQRRIMPKASRYAPAVTDNLPVLGYLALERSHALWNFVFAPNPTSSRAAAALKTLRRRPTVQTVPSQPAHFEGVSSLLFGDLVVTVSQATADGLVRDGFPANRVHVIPPPLTPITRSVEQAKRARNDLGIAPDVPMFVYAGDLEFSQGALRTAQAIPLVRASIPDAVFVFACRAKTQRAHGMAQKLREALAPHHEHVVFAGEIEDLPSLLASATALPFPVDNLFGKVDLPYVVLEAASLGVPAIVPNDGPLAELSAATQLDCSDIGALAERCIAFASSDRERRESGEALRRQVAIRHDPAAIAASYEELYLSLLQ